MIRPIAIEAEINKADQQLIIRLSNDAELRYPLTKFPNLAHASADQQQAVTIWGGGQFLRWESVDEDISVPQLLAGVCSWAMLEGEPIHSPATTIR